ncbi:hypothetical protein KL951_000663 [Ogataea haglerorum]|nr:hypothetical protein KL951_000663 [Ogataea haglerorum]
MVSHSVLQYLLVIASTTAAHYSSSFRADGSSCPSDIPLSCTNSSQIPDTCCFEYPGGVLLQTQFWDYDYPTGPDDMFTLHGLWPDNCDGTYSQFCDSSLQISDAEEVLISFGEQQLLERMHEVWKDYQGNDNNLWVHEFNKHGTCLSTIKPSCYENFETNREVVDYFRKSVELFEGLPTYKWLEAAGITPSDSRTYSKQQIDEALRSRFGKEVYFKCDRNHALNEIWYFHHLRGSIPQGNYVPIDAMISSNCPSFGIKFPLKKASSTSSDTITATKTSATSTATPTDNGGYLKLENQAGCLISNGKWFVSGTCATYKLSEASFGGYQLASSKGVCGIDSDGYFACGSGVIAAQFDYDSSSGHVTYGGQPGWSAGRVPSRNAQVPIVPGSSLNVNFRLIFEAR